MHNICDKVPHNPACYSSINTSGHMASPNPCFPALSRGCGKPPMQDRDLNVVGNLPIDRVEGESRRHRHTPRSAVLRFAARVFCLRQLPAPLAPASKSLAHVLGRVLLEHHLLQRTSNESAWEATKGQDRSKLLPTRSLMQQKGFRLWPGQARPHQA